MKNSRWMQRLMLILAGAFSAMPVHASGPIFSSFGTGGTYNTGQAYIISTSRAIAASFQVSANVQFTDVQLPLQSAGGQSAQVYLESDSGGQPGAVLDTLTQQTPVLGGYSTITFSCSTCPMLSAGSRYWVVATLVSGQYLWAFNTIGLNGAAVNASGSQSGGPWSTLPNPSPAFQVNGIGPAAALAFTAQPPAAGVAGVTFGAVVQVQDALGNRVASSAPVTVGSTTVNAVGGVATFSGLVFNAVGTYNLTASSPGLPNAVSTPIGIGPAPPSQLVFTTQPPSGTAGQALTPAPVVTIKDQFGNAANSNAPVTIGSMVVNASSGVAVFPNLVYNIAGSQSLTATSPGLPSAVSNPFTISASNGAQLVFTTQPPASQTAGVAFSAVVQIQDVNGNLATNSAAQVTIGGTTVNAVGGIATFSSLVLNTSGTYNLTATSAGLTSAISTPISITPAAASQLAFTTQPVSTTASQPLTPPPAVTIQDPFGNTVNSSAAVTIGTFSVNAAGGVATFPSLVFTTAGNFTLTASSPGIASATSNPFTISPGTGSKLVFTVQPPPVVIAGAPFAAAVQIQDAHGNPVTNSTTQVTIGSTSVNASGGVAAFNGLVLTKTGSFNLTATSTGLASAMSSSITINAAAGSQLAFTTQPSSGTAGQPLTPAPVVTIEDEFGNTADSNAPVTIGSSTVNAVGGVATFPNLVFGTSGNYTLTATSVGLNGATSNSFTISPGVGSMLVFTAQPPSNVVAGGGFGAVVQVQDFRGNLVSSSTAQVTIGATTVNAIGGIAAFTNLVLTAAGNTTVTATSTGLANATSSPITVAPGAASKLVFTTQPGSVPAGQPVSPAPVVTIEDQFGNTVGSTAPVTIGSTVVNAASGVAIFSNLVFNTGGNYTLTATSPGLANALSNPFTITVLTVATSTAVTVSGGPAYGQPVTFRAAVKPSTGANTPTGTVGFSVDGLPAGSAVPLVNGVAAVGNQILAAGSHSITATYTPANSDFSGSSAGAMVTIEKAVTGLAVSVAVAGPGSPGTSVLLTATLTPQYAGAPTGSVTFYAGTASLGSVPVKNGKATLPATAPAGAQTFRATYSGDSNFQSATAAAPAGINVPSIHFDILDPTLVYPLPAAFVVALKGSAGPPNGTLTVYDGSAKLTSGPLILGVTAGLTLPPLSVGVHSLTAVYSGDSRYAPAGSSSKQVTVSPAPVTIRLECKGTNSFKSGYPVTCTARVAGILPARGTLNWTIDGGPQTSTLDKTGAASIVLSNPALGTHTVAASFAAQGNFAAANPKTVSFTITK